MELATGGALSDMDTDRVRWPEARRLVLALLDALAHAHARGVIHQDIKFGNVLLPGGRDRRPGPKLTDFGIAATSHGQAAADPPADQLAAQTPSTSRIAGYRTVPRTPFRPPGASSITRNTPGGTSYVERTPNSSAGRHPKVA